MIVDVKSGCSPTSGVLHCYLASLRTVPDHDCVELEKIRMRDINGEPFRAVIPRDGVVHDDEVEIES